MKKRHFALIGLLIAASVLWGLRFAHLNRLEREITASTEQLARLKSASQTNSHELSAAEKEEMERLRALRPELMKLRGSIQQLRALKTKDPAELDQLAAEKKKQAEVLQAFLRLEDDLKLAAQGIQMALTLAVESARMSGEPMGGNFAEVRMLLSKAVEKNVRGAKGMLAWFDSPDPNRAGLDQFELIPQSPPLRPTKADPDQEILCIREKQAHQTPDGKWLRFYGWLNGRIEQAESANGDFSDWERAHATSRDSAKP